MTQSTTPKIKEYRPNLVIAKANQDPLLLIHINLTSWLLNNFATPTIGHCYSLTLQISVGKLRDDTTKSNNVIHQLITGITIKIEYPLSSNNILKLSLKLLFSYFKCLTRA